ncbi:exopolysaccharide biosynthesis protein chain length determinator [Actinomyces sp. Chiba101]|uniref:Capsular exopolysaccharide family n=1 Tax=Actinomyces denticolens TaxID=52767 RepID=A0ABY1HZA6_9ACTO|nr:MULTISPECIES: polysaccharide biosynthesis tyrosine autokinase [Actinomyces]BAW93567.1 exopolysaccharide biosynthesis protein chain length determinator [Actinomyces sp. Chiba101]GAV93586.1 exopolysaccharide biosynthesis protein chain length determinator [Actinomyces denticolens]SHI34859.1 capsular exopolysaccharide family [Actinomyces denticolens]SUU74526.1 Tyrosine-protein kinase YwqD [Actinomyces denticolens]
MTLEDLLLLARRSWRILCAGIIVGALLAAGAALLGPRSYTATSIAYVKVDASIAAAQDNPTSYQLVASQLAERKAKSLLPVITSETVAQGVIDSLGLTGTTPTALAGSIKAEHVTGADTVVVEATADSPERARRIADETVRQSNTEFAALNGDDIPVGVELMTSAELRAAPRSPSIMMLLGAGLLGGLVVAYLGVLVVEVLNKRVRGAGEALAVLDSPVLGALPHSDLIRNGADASDPAIEEELRKLRTNFIRATATAGRSAVISSAARGEGRSTITVGLARVLAMSGHRVVLVEGDLRAPSLASVLGVDGRRAGLAQVLAGAAAVEDALVRTSMPGLSVIPAGALPGNPSELLGSSRMTELLESLSAEAIVLIDSPPSSQATDAAVLAAQADGALLVVSTGTTTSAQLRQAAQALEQGGGRILGVVLNAVNKRGFLDGGPVDALMPGGASRADDARRAIGAGAPAPAIPSRGSAPAGLLADRSGES